MTNDRDMGSRDRVFTQEWERVAPRVDRFLAARGVAEHQREDYVQETAVRLYQMWDRIDHTRPLAALASTIALNLLRDDARKRREFTCDIPEVGSAQDVERESLARMELGRVSGALRHLTSAQRAVILEQVTGIEDTRVARGPSAAKMLRLRARRRLTTILETASAWVAISQVRLRRWFDENAQPTSVAVAAACALTLAPAQPAPTNSHESPRVTARTSLTQEAGPRSRASLVTKGPSPRRATPPDQVASAVTDVPANTERAVRVRVGSNEVKAAATIEVGDVTVQVGSGSGPVPACISGIDDAPHGVECAGPDSGTP